MIKLKNISIFKSKQSENKKAPTHSISAKIGEEYVNVGACWTKDTSKGDKFLSCKFQDAYVDHTDSSKSRKSFVVVTEEDLKALFARAGEDYVDEAQIPPTSPKTVPKTNVDAF